LDECISLTAVSLRETPARGRRILGDQLIHAARGLILSIVPSFRAQDRAGLVKINPSGGEAEHGSVDRPKNEPRMNTPFRAGSTRFG
jgi:hypothetical protein